MNNDEFSNVIFDYQPTRKGENAQAFLQEFTGYLVRDGYSGYHKVKGVKHCGCLIHCRRYFVNALPKEKKAHPSSVAAEAVRYFDRIYHEEGLLVNMTADERYKERLVKIKPLLDGLFARLETVQVSGKSALAKAVRYALHEKPFFYTFLQNGNVPPDNNRAECYRPSKMSTRSERILSGAGTVICQGALVDKKQTDIPSRRCQFQI